MKGVSVHGPLQAYLLFQAPQPLRQDVLLPARGLQTAATWRGGHCGAAAGLLLIGWQLLLPQPLRFSGQGAAVLLWLPCAVCGCRGAAQPS
jgi:hypothetical protein